MFSNLLHSSSTLVGILAVIGVVVAAFFIGKRLARKDNYPQPKKHRNRHRHNSSYSYRPPRRRPSEQEQWLERLRVIRERNAEEQEFHFRDLFPGF